ncbi:MAG: hypothetical protein GY832_14065 [Chloroflexi bacterium]|nr:hypothetical protein [Chloroflexota bacterium]
MVTKLRSIASFALVFCLLIAHATFGRTFSFAQDTLPQATSNDITVIESSVDHDFAQQITFTLQASSDAEITQVYLFFRAEGDEHTKSVSVDFESGHDISVSHMHDLRRSPLPPFATINFWWKIENAAGNELTTNPIPHEYTDNRSGFVWEQLSDNNITVHWIKDQGDPILGQAVLDAARIGIEEANAELHAPIPETINIYIYNSQLNLNATMGLTGRDWVVGQAHPELNVILVAIPIKDGYTSLIKHYIPHEITHLLVYQKATTSGYRYIPEWLDEGLATANEQLPTPDHTLAVEQAAVRGQLLPLEDLCVPFAPDYETAFLSYAQSNSVVKFIRKQHGAEGIRQLLTAYANGASCTTGVQDALQISLGELETVWHTSLGIPQENPEPDPEENSERAAERIGIWAWLWLLSILVATPMIGRLGKQ